MTARVTRALFPFTLVIAVALWAKGSAEVGDGFSAGAFAGTGAIIQYVCLDHERAGRVVGARFAYRLIALGLALALSVVLVPVFFGLPLVTHFPAPGHALTKVGLLELHTGLVFDLGVALVIYGTVTGTFHRLFPPFEEEEA